MGLLENLNKLFAIFPNVEALSVEIDANYDDRTHIVQFPASLRHFPILLSCAPSLHIAAVVRSLRAHRSNIRDFAVRSKGDIEVTPRDVRRFLGTAVAPVVAELACWSSDTERIRVQMTTLDAHRYAFLDLAPATHDQWPPVSFDSITVLRIGDNILPSFSALPSAPALVELEIMLLSVTGADLFDGVSALCKGERGFALLCPSLSTLAIADRRESSEGHRIMLSAQSIQAFIEQRLAFSADKLARLVLRGPRLDNGMPPSSATFVDRVDFEEGVPAPLADIQDILSWN